MSFPLKLKVTSISNHSSYEALKVTATVIMKVDSNRHLLSNSSGTLSPV